MAQLFTPLKLRDLTFRNRIFCSPMCQYSSRDGLPTPWHFVHLGTRAVGGAALVMVEATAVTAEGRISPVDSGLWSDAHADAFRPITAFVRERGAAPGVQLAHAGRKASTGIPWEGGGGVPPERGGWQPLGPGDEPFAENYPTPRALDEAGIQGVIAAFAAAARRAHAAGFEVVEIHAAHGYLLHSFLSPLVNRRKDAWGGSLENRMRLPLAVAKAVREAWPETLPLFVRISSTDWVEHGWDLPQSIELAQRLKQIGVDLIDCSSGGAVPNVKVPVGPGYQVPFAADIRRQVGIPTGAVGMITEADQAEQILADGRADAIIMARELLRNPYWPLHVARELGAEAPWPEQYLRAKI